MAKLRVISKLANGESIIGEFVSLEGNTVKLTDKNGDTIRFTVVDAIAETIDDEINEGDIMELKALKSSFEIFVHDEWPEEKAE